MLGSMHAVRLTHLQHHRECLGANDVEGTSARRSAAGALLWGIIFPVQLHLAALRLASPRQVRWILAELSLTCGWIAVILTSEYRLVWYHVAAMALGQTLTGFFAVWTVHHDCDRWQQIARTLRHRLKSAVACTCSIISSIIFTPGCRRATCPRSLSGSTRQCPSLPASRCSNVRCEA